MRSFSQFLACAVFFGAACSSHAAPIGKLNLTVEGIENGQPIPAEYAVCVPTADGKSDNTGKNLRPTIYWSGVPEGTKSFAVFIMDPDVPADFTDAGKEGRVIAETAKRQDFYHYAVVNIPVEAAMLAGSNADKNPSYGTEIPNDMGLNGYVPTPAAYGGPCPPWNDQRVHNYHFVVLALDKDAPVNILREPIGNPKPADDPMTAKHTFGRLITSKHVLARGTVVGTYTLNPQLQPQQK